jgi:hypothetical protein
MPSGDWESASLGRCKLYITDGNLHGIIVAFATTPVLLQHFDYEDAPVLIHTNENFDVSSWYSIVKRRRRLSFSWLIANIIVSDCVHGPARQCRCLDSSNSHFLSQTSSWIHSSRHPRELGHPWVFSPLSHLGHCGTILDVLADDWFPFSLPWLEEVEQRERQWLNVCVHVQTTTSRIFAVTLLQVFCSSTCRENVAATMLVKHW